MSAFIAGFVVGVVLACAGWGNLWFAYSLRKNIPVDDLWSPS